MTDSAPSHAEETSSPTTEIIAKPAKFYRGKWIFMAIAMIGWGWYSLYDGYIRYPRLNAEAEARGLTVLPHGGYDIPLNRLIGFGLQPVGIAALIWVLYNSRGQYRLTNGDTLHIPGHPPVQFSDIRAIDQTKWDRKGLAYIDYEASGKSGQLKLDDYAYEREPTDEIFDRILKAVAPEEAAEAENVGTEKTN